MATERAIKRKDRAEKILHEKRSEIRRQSNDLGWEIDQEDLWKWQDMAAEDLSNPLSVPLFRAVEELFGQLRHNGSYDRMKLPQRNLLTLD